MHPDKRTPSTPDIQPHTRMFLGSDFVSPAEVLVIRILRFHKVLLQ